MRAWMAAVVDGMALVICIHDEVHLPKLFAR